MNKMRSLILLSGLLSSAVAALGIDASEVPAACQTICRPLVQLSNACAASSSSDCICKNTSFDVLSLGSACAICCQQTNMESDDLKSISSACSFTQGAYNQISASSVAATVVVTATAASNSIVTLSSTESAVGAATGKATGTAASSSSSKGAAAGGMNVMAMPTMGALAAAAFGAMVL